MLAHIPESPIPQPDNLGRVPVSSPSRRRVHPDPGRRSKDKPQRDEARRLLEHLRDRYGDLAFRDTTYRAIATAMLSPHSPDALEVGKIAPEISGVDVTGSAVQLSDHRGKIVLLDFWGDW